jgi:hypothetical protein
LRGQPCVRSDNNSHDAKEHKQFIYVCGAHAFILTTGLRISA